MMPRIVVRSSTLRRSLAAAWCAAALAAAPEARAGRYHEEVLDNGLRAVLIEHHANPMVASAVVVGAGVVHEPPGMNGASHFLEHLLFNGTETRTQRQLYDEVDFYGAYNNATTREDHTLFTLLIQKEFAEAGLALQADMLFHSTLPEDKFDKEKGIVLEEMARDRTDSDYLAGLVHRGFAYAGTPVARPVLGTEASIAALARDDVMAYYRSRYVPANMTLVLMGDFEIDAMRATVARVFGAAATSGPPTQATGTWPPPPESNLLRAPLEAGRTYVFATLPLAVASHDPRLPALELLLDALAGGEDAPLDRALTGGAEPVALSLSLGLARRSPAWSSVELRAVLGAGGEASAVLDRVQAEIRGLGPGSPAWDRIETVRASARNDEILLADKIHYYALMRSDSILGAPPGWLRDRAAVLEGIGDPQLEAAARLLREALARARAVVVGPGIEQAEQVWSTSAEPIERGSPLERVEETLDSGLRFDFRRNDDSRVFAIHVMFRPRSASEPEGREGIADFLHRLYLRGSLVRDAAGLDAAFDALGASVKTHDIAMIPYDDYQTGPEFSFVRLEMPSDRWREGLALLAEVILHPRLDPDDVEAVRHEMLDLLARRGESARSAASALLVRTLAPGHPASRDVLGTPESVRAISLEDLRAFHAAYVTGRRTVLTGTGPVNPEAALRAVREVFGGLPSGDEPPGIVAAPPTEPGLEAERALGLEQSYLALGYLFDAAPEDLPALQVAGAMLSDRLAFDLREERGLAYSIGASVDDLAGRTAFRVLMGTRPENLDEALSGLRQGISAFVGDGDLDDSAVRRAANALRGRAMMRRMSRINLAYYAGIEILEGRPPGDDARRLDALLEVSAEDVRRVARRYLSAERCAVITVR